MPRRARAPTVPMTVEGPKGGTPHAALSGRADVSGRARGSRRSRGRGGLPRGHRAQRARGRHLAAFLRERGQAQDVLRLRRAQPGGDPQERRGQRPAGGRDDRGPRAGPLSVLLREEEPMLKRLFRPSPAMAVACLALFVGLGGTALAASYVVSSNSQVGPGTISGHKPPTGAHANVIGGSLNATDLAPGAVTRGKLGADSVNGDKVVNGSLTAADADTTSLQRRVTGTCPS